MFRKGGSSAARKSEAALETAVASRTFVTDIIVTDHACGHFAMASFARCDGSAASSDRPQDQPMWYAAACEALETGKCLEIRYRHCLRIVEVHRVGIGPAGEHIMSGWQIRGPGSERVGWKLLNLDKPESLTLTDIPSLAPRPDYRRGAKQFIGIICQL